MITRTIAVVPPGISAQRTLHRVPHNAGHHHHHHHALSSSGRVRPGPSWSSSILPKPAIPKTHTRNFHVSLSHLEPRHQHRQPQQLQLKHQQFSSKNHQFLFHNSPQKHNIHTLPTPPPETLSDFTTTMATPKGDDHFLTLSCPDKPGIVYAVTALLAAQSLTILDLQQFSDPVSKTFFMRVHFGHTTTLSSLETPLSALATEMQMDYQLRPVSQKPRVLIMVSKIGHCLNDLLFRVKSGQLKIEVPAIVSNHPDFEELAKSYGIPFYHLPVSKDTKVEQETRILELIAEHAIDLVVLARYMQVLSPRLCSEMSGKIINIHHSFLPSFKGAKPYHQAYDRGVKIIGASAHFVTKDLDEGPIIEQRVARVDHGMGPRELVEEGSNVESQVLAAAVKWWSERRVFLNGGKTVVFN